MSALDGLITRLVWMAVGFAMAVGAWLLFGRPGDVEIVPEQVLKVQQQLVEQGFQRTDVRPEREVRAQLDDSVPEDARPELIVSGGVDFGEDVGPPPPPLVVSPPGCQDSGGGGLTLPPSVEAFWGVRPAMDLAGDCRLELVRNPGDGRYVRAFWTGKVRQRSIHGGEPVLAVRGPELIREPLVLEAEEPPPAAIRWLDLELSGRGPEPALFAQVRLLTNRAELRAWGSWAELDAVTVQDWTGYDLEPGRFGLVDRFQETRLGWGVELRLRPWKRKRLGLVAAVEQPAHLDRTQLRAGVLWRFGRPP